jgi:hypothetical protein
MRLSIFVDPDTQLEIIEIRNSAGDVVLCWPPMEDARGSTYYKLAERFVCR